MNSLICHINGKLNDYIIYMFVNWPQWINSLTPSEVQMYLSTWPSLFQIMTCSLFSAKPYLIQCWFVIAHWDRDKMDGIFPDDIFKCIFLNGNIKISIKKITEVCSQGSNQLFSSIGSDNGVAPGRRQTIIWTNNHYFTDACMRESA